ncbi:TonB-dependent receptor plug domain-containing protein [Luteimonas sp. RIT-PG2_3]
MSMPLCRLAAAISSLLVASSALAQSPTASNPTNLDAVTVTGSHIKGARLSGVGPVSVVDAEMIARSGATSIDTLLQRLPASAGFAGNQTNAYWTGNGYGTAQVNLRGIGINRTLVLLNGRRIVNGGTGANSSVDLNVIPVSVIERIEVLKDGASAIYGADAVAGVVNIITKKNFEGVELGLRYGQTFENDGADQAFDLTWGTHNDRGSLMASLSYSEGKAVNMASRQPCGLGEVNGQLECVGSSATIGGRALLADGSMVNFNQDPNGDGDFFEPYASKHNYHSYSTLNAVNPIKRVSFSAFGDLKLTDNVDLFTELLMTNRRSNQLASPGSIGQYRPVRIAANHPTNPTGQALTLVRRRLEEAGPRHFYQDVDTYRAVLGLQGGLGDTWNWSTAINWGRSTGVDGSSNVANLDRVDQTLNTAVCSNAPGAAIPCGDYLGYGDLSQQVIDYIMFTTRDTGGNEQRSFSANLDGQLFEMPAGWVGFATGIEIRNDRGWRDPDMLTQWGIANSNRAQRVRGEYDVREMFAEVSVPLLADKPFADALTFNAAVRYSDYDLFGGDTNYKIGLDWQASEAFKMRAIYSTAFRIPNIPELFGGITEGNLTTTDPCSGWSNQPTTSPIYQNCQADGLPVGYTQLGNTVLTRTGGNIDLKPEDAKTFTIGAVWTPGFAPGLTMTADYFDIRIDNAIQSVAGSTKLAYCYNTPGLSHPFCSDSNFTRNPITGEIDFLSSQPVNAASERISGIDLGALYEFTVANLNATLSVDVSYLDRYDLTPYQGASVIEYAGKITGGRGSYAKWRSFSSLVLAQGPWSGSYSLQYIGGTDDINAPRGAIGDHAGSLTYHNVQLKYAVSSAMDLALGVDNLWDKQAPFIQSYTDANTDTMTYDLLGRRWNAKLTYRW